MTILLYTLSILTTILGMFYVMQHKKKLSNENLIEFERSIKPKLVRFLLLSFIPVLLMCYYLLDSTGQINIRYIIGAALGSILLIVFGYIKSKIVINQSKNAEHFKYALNYFIFIGLGLLFLLSAVAYTLREFLVY